MTIRRISRLAILAALAAGLGLGFAAAPALAGDLESLAGKWKAENVGPERNVTMILEIQTGGKAFSIETSAGPERKHTITGELRIDPTAKPPQIDFLKAKGVVAGKPGENDLPTRRGIYKLDGDKLIVRAGETRPQALEGEEAEKDFYLIKLQRVKN